MRKILVSKMSDHNTCFLSFLRGIFSEGKKWNERKKGSKRGGRCPTHGDPGGMPIGIYLETEGVMVLGTEKVTGTDGERLEPARHLVKAGDYIVECNGTKIRDKKNCRRY